jgi:uncharacterized membrane protein
MKAQVPDKEGGVTEPRSSPTHSLEHFMARIGSGFAVASIALLAAVASVAQQSVVVQGALCRGEEPFWQLEASRSTAVFNRLANNGNREVIFHGAPQAFMFLAPAAVVWRGDSTHLPRETLVVALREESCRPTIGDAPALPWRAMLSIKAGEALTGCCTVLAGYDVKVAPVAEFGKKSPDDWSRALPELLPAINLCWSNDEAHAKWIAKAGPAGNGMSTVRMVQASGKALDCETDASGRGAVRIAAVNTTDPPLLGAGNPLFYPARDLAPMVRCGKLERVMGPGGKVLGYLHYDPC